MVDGFPTGEVKFIPLFASSSFEWKGVTVASGEDDIVQTYNSIQSASQLQLMRITSLKNLLPTTL